MKDKILKVSNLRKTNTFIEIDSESVGAFNVHAVETEFVLTEDNAIFRTTLKPAGSNEKEDSDKTFLENTNVLNEVIFNDKKIRKLAGEFLQAYRDRVDYQNLKLQINYKGTHTFIASISSKDTETVSLKIKT